MSKRVPLEQALTRKIPERAVQHALWHLRKGRVQLRIARPRVTKLGDFSPGRKSEPNAISVNADLNQYQFLWTLVHELAHLYTWDEYGRQAAPHGIEWKRKFEELMEPYLNGGIFPEELERMLRSHLRSAAASTCSDPALYKLFSTYDDEPKHFVDEVKSNEVFILKGGRQFRKGKKRRTRYECLDLGNGQVYLVHGHAEIETGVQAV